jgi:pimeloyl-ACP methyl ester carboxylesterase
MGNDRLQLGDVALDVVRKGSGPPLLFLHGENGLLHDGPLLDLLAEQHEVVAPLHPSFPGSSCPTHITSVADVAFTYIELVEQLGRPVPVVGVSLGGWIAAQMAVTHSALLSALVLVSPLGIKTRDRETRDFADIYLTDYAELPALFYGDEGAVPSEPTADEDFVYLATCQEATARFCWAPYMHDPKLIHRLRRVSVPTVVLSGSEERFVLDPDYFDVFADRIGASARRDVVAGAGHRLDEERPDAVAAAVTAMLTPHRAVAVGTGAA